MTNTERLIEEFKHCKHMGSLCALQLAATPATALRLSRRCAAAAIP